MNTLESFLTTSPFGDEEECAKIHIDNIVNAFVLHDISVPEQNYTFSCWVKSDSAGMFTIGWSTFSTSDVWTKCVASFIADSKDVAIGFDTVGTYYIYHPQLENGTLATDWTIAPEDVDDRFAGNEHDIDENKKQIDDNTGRVSQVEASLQILADSVITRVTDEDGDTSQLTQTGTGWIFSLQDLENSVSDALDAIAALTESQANALSAIDTLKDSVSDHSKLADYVAIGEYNGQPCIELGEVGGDFKLRITNTEMYFIAGSTILTTITNQKMIAEKIEVTQELQQGNFVWMLHGNGNLGLLWKGASS